MADRAESDIGSYGAASRKTLRSFHTTVPAILSLRSRFSPLSSGGRSEATAGSGKGRLNPPTPGAIAASRGTFRFDPGLRERLHSVPGPHLFKIELGRLGATETKPRATVVWMGRLSFVLNASAVVAVLALKLFLVPPGLTSGPAVEIAAVTANNGPVAHQTVKPAGPARLVVQKQSGVANEPLSIGISVEQGSGDETVTVTGLADGTELSLGSSQGPSGWLLPIGDLGSTFVGPPGKFVGTMRPTVTLRSSSGQILDRRDIELEWTSGAGVGNAAAPAAASPVIQGPGDHSVQQTDATEVVGRVSPPDVSDWLRVANDLLQHGDVVSARIVLKRAAAAGSAQGALELGMTFDESFLRQLGAMELAPDTTQARQWYEKAIELGSMEAVRQQHDRLGGLSR
jgi:hypothetical protein